MDPAVKTLKAALEAIRDIAANALNQVGHSQGERSMRWKCKACQYLGIDEKFIEHFELAQKGLWNERLVMSALNRAPFVLRCRFRRVTNKTCSRVRHRVFHRARRHSSSRSKSAARGVALVRLPRGQDAAQISQFFVHVFGFKDRIAHDFA